MPNSFLGYLQQRNAGFYFRRKVPDPLRPLFGRRELYWSLETPFRSLAQTRALESWSFSNQLLEAAQAHPHHYQQDDLDLAISAFKVLARSRWSRQAIRSSSGGTEPKRLNQQPLEATMLPISLDPQYKTDLRSFLERSILTSTHAFEDSLHTDPASVMGAATLGKLESALRSYLEDPDHNQLPFDTEGGLKELMEACRSASPGIGTSDPGAAKRYFNREFSKAFLRIVEANRRILVDPGFSLPAYQDTRAGDSPHVAAAKPGAPAISMAWEEYKQEVKWKPNSERQFDALIRDFISPEFVGDKPVSALTRDDIIGFRNTQRKLPARREKSREYRDKTVAELVAMDIPAHICITERTINNKLTTLGTFFNWCHKIKGYLDKDILYKTQYQKVVKAKRGVYTTAHLNALFDPAHYRPSLINKPFKFWIPLLGLHTGARISELAQLKIEDVVERDGIVSIRIYEGDPDQSVKSVNGKRLVPVHETLLQLGFAEFVLHQRERGVTRLFPELPGTDNKAGAPVTKWFTEFRRKRGIPDRNALGEQLVFHSFRHTVTTTLRHSNVSGKGHDVTMVQQIVGHKRNSNGATDIYTHAYDDQTCKTVIDTLDFKLDIPRLREAWQEVFTTYTRRP